MTGLRFLLLEDSLLDAELIQANLSEGEVDCELVRVSTRAEFVAALESSAFDLILSDYSLPAFDGISALELAHEVCPEVPFIFVTATLGEEVAIETLKRGATDYVVKQRLDRLAACVQRALQEAEERTARQQAEAELFRREQEFRALVENSPDIISRFDRQLRYVYINPAIARATGLSPEAFVGKTNTELGFPGGAVQRWEDQLRHSFTTGQSGAIDFEFASPNDKRFYQSQMVPEFALDGSVQSVLVISRDLTESKQAEQALRQREAQLRQQAEALEQANRVKDEFLAVLSHELRSPLNSILGWAKLLRTRQYDAATTARALETIERNATLQTQLIEDLLDISRIIRGKLTLHIAPVNLLEPVAAAIETMKLAAMAKSIAIDFAAEAKTARVSGDSNRLQQVVWNLLSNAIKFTPEGGRVAVRLSTAAAQAVITVSDTGKGITPDFLPYVFEYFRQSDASITRSHGGLGLGLAIVRHLVELHGGTVSAASSGEGQGATFTVWLPLLRESVGRQADAVQPAAPAALNAPYLPLANLTILVVDDESDSRDFVGFVLREGGAAVIVAGSMGQALCEIRRNPPDVMVSDIGMPEADGYILLRTVRSLEPKWGKPIAAIALTAYAREEDRDRALAAGYQLHLAKPIDPVSLTAAVLQVVGRA